MLELPFREAPKWRSINLLMSSQGKCHVLLLGWANPLQLGRLGLQEMAGLQEQPCVSSGQQADHRSAECLHRQQQASRSGLAKGSHQLEAALVRPRWES